MGRRIVVASDHAAVELRQEMAAEARALGYEVTDLGPAPGEAVDYPVNGGEVGRLVAAGEYDLGLIACGTGVGISIAANKVRGIRAVVCSEPFSAKLARQHNNANVLALGARVVGPGLARLITHEFLTAEFEGGRHAHRVGLIDDLESAPDRP